MTRLITPMPRPLSRQLPLRLLAAAALAGGVLLQACSTVPDANARLDQARSAYAAAQADPLVRDGAPAELKQAADALARASDAWNKREDAASVDHLAYLAAQRVALARQAGERRAAEADIARAGAERDQLRLAARTREADSAQRSAQAAQVDARASQIQAQSAERDARQAQGQADASQRQAVAAQEQAAASERRTQMLEQQLRDLDAKKTPRGMVVTIGDVLFDSGRSDIKPGGERSMDKLVGFLKEFPARQALVEGFTDSVGGAEPNQALSARRADAVRGALVARGIDAGRIQTQGHGEGYPVASNDSAGGRQMNRRVEIVLSEDGGRIAPR